MSEKKKRYVSFTFDRPALKECYPGGSVTEAGKKVLEFLWQNGFERTRQFRCVSKEPITDSELQEIMTRMGIEMPWLCDCLRSFKAYSVYETYSLKDILNGKEE